MAPTTEKPEAMVTESPVGADEGKENAHQVAAKKAKAKGATGKKKESDVDYPALEKQIAQLKAGAAGNTDEAKLAQTLEKLLALEKTYRLQADLKATSMCCVAVVQVKTYFLISLLLLFLKKREVI